MEWREELLQAKDRFEHWELSRLVEEGFTVPDLRAEVCGRFYGRLCVRFTSESGAPLPSVEFQRGDHLIVSQGDPLRSRLKAQVLSASSEAVTCVMRAPPPGEGPWRLDRGPNEVSHARTQRGLRSFEEGRGQEQVRRLLLELDGDERNSAPALRLRPAATLDDAQRAALRSVEQKRVSLIQGPPGCGKTHTSCALLRAAYRGRPLLAVADSNVAVDQLLQGLLGLGMRAVRFGSPVSITDEALLGATVDSMLWDLPGSEEWQRLHDEVGELRQQVQELREELEARGGGAGPGAAAAHAEARAGGRLGVGGAGPPAAFEGRLEALARRLEEFEPLAGSAETARPGALELLVQDALAALPGVGSGGSEPAAARPRGAPAPSAAPAAAPPQGCPWDQQQGELLSRLALAERQLSEQLQRCASLEQDLVGEIFEGAEVVCATITGCGSDAFSGKSFDMVLMDEASQATEPRALIAVSRLARDGRLVLVGDQKQLPPTCISQRAREKGLGLSLFDRLLGLPCLAPALLAVQYRMHPLIRQWPSEAFYGGRLLDGVPASLRLPVPGLRWPAAGGVAFVESGAPEERSPDGCSWQNRGEGRLVGALLRGLAQVLPPEDVGVISPYRGQVRLLRQQLPAGPEVKTVDGYQGREKSVIVISCVRSNPEGRVGFLSDPRRLNVALTRAKRGLIVVGDRSTLQHCRHWRSWFDFVDAHRLAVAAEGLMEACSDAIA